MNKKSPATQNQRKVKTLKLRKETLQQLDSADLRLAKGGLCQTAATSCTMGGNCCHLQ